MPWVRVRVTTDLDNDPLWDGLTFGAGGTLTQNQMIEAGTVAMNYPGLQTVLMDVRLWWLDAEGLIVPGHGQITVEPLFLDDYTLPVETRVFSLGEPRVSGAYRPLQLEVAKRGFVSCRLTNMDAPPTATQAAVHIWQHR